MIADDRLRVVATGGALDGSNAANGGKNPDGADVGTVPDDVPSTAIDPYAAIPGGLTQNVGSGFRNVFVSGTNDPAQVSASNVTVDEGSATLNLTALVGAFAVADPDDNGASNLSATVTVSKGVISAVGGSGGTVGGTGTATVTITFKSAYAATPRAVIVTCVNGVAIDTGHVSYAVTTTSLVLTYKVLPAAGAYTFDYLVIA